MSGKNKCETCWWWKKHEIHYHPTMDERAVKEHQEEMAQCGHTGECWEFPVHTETTGKHFCGQWKGKQ